MSDPDDSPTCGKGLAAHASLPATMAAVLAALADNLAHHVDALVADDADTRGERDAYVTLVTAFREHARSLATTAATMAGHRDLPMGTHDEAAMAAPAVREAFARYVALAQELHAQLGHRLEQDRAMLAAW